MEWYIAAGSAEKIPRYDCSITKMTSEEHLNEGSVNYFLGLSFIIYGLIAEVLYVVVMTVMMKPEFHKYSCYKIMLVLGAYDMLAIGVNSLLTGYFWIVGGSYCSHPDLIITKMTSEEHLNEGSVNYFLGLSFIIYGLIAEVLYVVVMTVMMKPEFHKYSCYKIMLVLGAYDMLAIGVNSLLTGYFWIVGGSYCSHPDLMFISGAIGLGLWCGACMNCLVLVSNRLLDLWKPHLMGKIFGGNKTYAILSLPLLYSAYFTFFTSPLLFNSKMTAWFFDPFINQSEHDTFLNYPHTANNLLVVVATCFLYGFLCYVLLHKYKQEGAKITWAQKSIIIQSTAICMANLVAALIYVYMQFFPTPQFLILIGHMSWQAGHGIPAFVYLIMNRTIQREVIGLFGFRKRMKVSATTNLTTASAFHI